MLEPHHQQHALVTPLHGKWELVHGPLEHWASTKPNAIALQSELRSVTFARLYSDVQKRRAEIIASRAPRMMLLNTANGTVESIVEFLSIIASGRCAAVDDPEWPPAMRERVMQSLPNEACDLRDAEPLGAFYAGFTSGSTGTPKGFMRHHRSWTESFRVGIQDFGATAAQRILSPGRMSHSLFLFGVMQGLWSGMGAMVLERFSARRCLHWLAKDMAPVLIAVPSQLLLMMQWAGQHGAAPINGVQLILISGARWMRSQTPVLQRLFPNARIVEFYGASETSYIAWMEADVNAPASAVGKPFSSVELSIRPSTQDASQQHQGLIFLRSPMLFMDYVGHNVDRTGVLRDGDWMSVRDMGHIDANGLLHLAGRESRMIVTRGKNLFPEELEDLLQEHPAIARASVLGTPDTLRGMQLHAVIQLREGLSEPPLVQQLSQWLRDRAEAFKQPKHWWVCENWPQTRSGKTDHQTIANWVLSHSTHKEVAHANGDSALIAWKT